MASRALRPSHGSAAAWACRPVNVTSTSSQASRRHSTCVARRWMEQQRGVEALEQPVVDHHLLAGAALLGGRPEEDDLALQVRGNGRQADRRRHAGRRHRVVAAAVAETGQRVVLREDADPRPRARLPRQAVRGLRSPAVPPGAPPRSHEAAIASATQVAAWRSSNAGSGLAWIRWLSSRICGRAATIAAAARRFRAACGSVGAAA